MTDASSGRFGGNAMMYGGMCWAAALILHPDVSTFELAAAVNSALWMFVHLLYIAGDILVVAGLVALSGHLGAWSGGANAGWAAVAVTAGVMGFTIDIPTTGLHMFALPVGADAGAATAQMAYDAITPVNGGISSIAFFMDMLGLLLVGVALSKAKWSPMVAMGTMLVGAAMILLIQVLPRFTGGPLLPAGIVGAVISALVPLGYSVIGWEYGKRSG